MAIPKNHSEIATNLPASQLEKVLKALEKKETRVVPDSHSLFAGNRGWKVELDGAQYEITEDYEEVCSVYLVSAPHPFINSLVSDLEAGISAAVTARDYDRAKMLNQRVESLKRI